MVNTKYRQFTLRLLACLLMVTATLWAEAKTYVVVAAVDVRNTLRGYAVKNARTIAEFYRLQGAESVRTFYNKEATRNNIIGALQSIARTARKGDAVFFIYSGHGYAESSIFNGGVTTADKSGGYLGYDEIQILLKNIRAGKKVAFINSCYSGGLTAKKKKRSKVKPRENASDANVLLYLSSKGSESSFMTNDGFDFLRCVTNGLKGNADANADKVVTARELFNYVNPIIERTFHVHPQMWGNFEDGMELSHIRPAKYWRKNQIIRPVITR